MRVPPAADLNRQRPAMGERGWWKKVSPCLFGIFEQPRDLDQVRARRAVIGAARYGHVALGLFEKLHQRGQMIGHPDVVVAEIGNGLR